MFLTPGLAVNKVLVHEFIKVLYKMFPVGEFALQPPFKHYLTSLNYYQL